MNKTTKISQKDVIKLSNGHAMFFCPGCKYHHAPNISNERNPSGFWGWNEDKVKPTITPSILVTVPQSDDVKAKGFQEKPAVLMPRRCHSFVEDGQIRFLLDCTHELAGKTVDLPTIIEARDE